MRLFFNSKICFNKLEAKIGYFIRRFAFIFKEECLPPKHFIKIFQFMYQVFPVCVFAQLWYVFFNQLLKFSIAVFILNIMENKNGSALQTCIYLEYNGE